MPTSAPGPESPVCQLLAWERRVVERQLAAAPGTPDLIELPLGSDAARKARLQDIVDRQDALGCLGQVGGHADRESPEGVRPVELGSSPDATAGPWIEAGTRCGVRDDGRPPMGSTPWTSGARR